MVRRHDAVLEALRRRSPSGWWWAASPLARHLELSVGDVRRVLRELAERGRVERAVQEESGKLQERWRLAVEPAE